MTELQQLRNVQKQRVVNIHHTNAAVSQIKYRVDQKVTERSKLV